MFGLLLRGALFLSVVMAYTLSVWNLIDNYFREELKRYMNKEQEFSTVSQTKELNFTISTLGKCYISDLFTGDTNINHKNNV